MNNLFHSGYLGRLVIWLADARIMGVEVLAAPAPVVQPTAAV